VLLVPPVPPKPPVVEERLEVEEVRVLELEEPPPAIFSSCSGVNSLSFLSLIVMLGLLIKVANW
jgi:hypothetical protein